MKTITQIKSRITELEKRKTEKEFDQADANDQEVQSTILNAEIDALQWVLKHDAEAEEKLEVLTYTLDDYFADLYEHVRRWGFDEGDDGLYSRDRLERQTEAASHFTGVKFKWDWTRIEDDMHAN